MGIDYDMGTTLPVNPSLYRSIFACLGVYSTNHTLTSAEGQALAEFLDYGGRVYMEGGDTWAFDSETAVHSYFNIEGLEDGGSDAGPIEGGGRYVYRRHALPVHGWQQLDGSHRADRHRNDGLRQRHPGLHERRRV